MRKRSNLSYRSKEARRLSRLRKQETEEQLNQRLQASRERMAKSRSNKRNQNIIPSRFNFELAAFNYNCHCDYSSLVEDPIQMDIKVEQEDILCQDYQQNINSANIQREKTLETNKQGTKDFESISGLRTNDCEMDNDDYDDEDEEHKCTLCARLFQSQKLFKAHIKEHTKLDGLLSDSGGEEKSQTIKDRETKNADHPNISSKKTAYSPKNAEESPYKCLDCPKKYASKGQLQNQRSPNFTEEEVKLLLKQIDKHKEVLNCKRSDVVSVHYKNETWKQLSLEYNSENNGPFRDEKTLRKKYENLKKDLKKRLAEKYHMYGTDGGSPSKTNCTVTTDVILEDLSDGTSLYEMDGVYDGANAAKDVTICPIDGNVTLNDETTNENFDSNEHVEAIPVGRKKPIGIKRTGRRRESRTSWDKLAAIKAKWAVQKSSIEKKYMEEEHKQRMRVLQLQQEEIQKRMCYEEIEHKMRIGHK